MGTIRNLKVCVVYDRKCLSLAGSLGQCNPALRVENWFDCERNWPNFTIAVRHGGAEIYYVSFETTHLASLIIDTAKPRCSSAIHFYLRTPERDLAASSYLGDCLALFLRRPDLVAGWRRSDDSAASTVYLLPDADKAGHLVLALHMIQGSASLLRNVNRHGGYTSIEQMSLDQMRLQFPELAAEVDRLVLQTITDRMEHLAWQIQEAADSAEDPEIVL